MALRTDRLVAVCALALIVSCKRSAPPPAGEAREAAPSASSASSSGSVVVASDAGAAFSLPGIPAPAAPKAGPLRVEGYPLPLDAGMSDPASPFGFTRDGASLVYCAFDVCCAEGYSSCTFVDAAGKETAWTTPGSEDPARAPAGVTYKTRKELEALGKTEPLLALGPQNPTTYKKAPPPVTGTFAFGGEMTLVARAIAPSFEEKHPAGGNVKLGARLDGEKEVFVVFPPLPDMCRTAAGVCMEAELNGLFLSPNGEELGMLVFLHHPSHGATHIPVRIPVKTFAARVFNDTGMLHHGKKEWAKAAELFTRAVYADPTQEKFAFNLACALARQDDPRAEHALRHAVHVGGDAVRARARKDEDLASVRTAPWFEAALAAR